MRNSLPTRAACVLSAAVVVLRRSASYTQPSPLYIEVMRFARHNKLFLIACRVWHAECGKVCASRRSTCRLHPGRSGTGSGSRLCAAEAHTANIAITPARALLCHFADINLGETGAIARKRNSCFIARPGRMRMRPLRAVHRVVVRFHPTQGGGSAAARGREVLGQSVA